MQRILANPTRRLLWTLLMEQFAGEDGLAAELGVVGALSNADGFGVAEPTLSFLNLSKTDQRHGFDVPVGSRTATGELHGFVDRF